MATEDEDVWPILFYIMTRRDEECIFGTSNCRKYREVSLRLYICNVEGVDCKSNRNKSIRSVC